ncbi:FkbM family methyltransferase [Candidatus Uhrbacteria bacterium]|nr:FkbM family methyltransferase [Candidatus Uhrbacteria bacterium]
MNFRSATALWTDFKLSEGPRHTANAIGYLWARHVCQQPVLRRRVFDYELELDLADPGIAKTLAIFGKRELEHRLILQRVLRPGMVVWDCGANIGYYAVMEARLVGPTGFVYTCEPAPSNIAFLRRNITLNGLADRVAIEECAISNHDGTATFHLSDLSNVHTLHPTSHRTGATVARMSGRTIAVPTFDVPTFLSSKRSVDLVRMDIEGHEVEVFEGIARAVRSGKFHGMILFETHFRAYNDATHSMRAQLRALFALGYRATALASSDERGTPLHALGYKPEQTIRTDGATRGLYRGVRTEDAERVICDLGGVRTVLLTCASS